MSDSPTLQPVSIHLDGVGWQYPGGNPETVVPPEIWAHIGDRHVIHVEAGTTVYENPLMADAIRKLNPEFTNIYETEYMYWFDPGRIYCHAGEWIVLTEDGGLVVVDDDRVRPRSGMEVS